MYIYIHVHCDQWLKQLAYLIDQFWLGLQWLARLIRIYMCIYIAILEKIEYADSTNPHQNQNII